MLGDKEADRTAGTIGVSLSLATKACRFCACTTSRRCGRRLLLYEATGGIDGHAGDHADSDMSYAAAACRASDVDATGFER